MFQKSQAILQPLQFGFQIRDFLAANQISLTIATKLSQELSGLLDLRLGRFDKVA